MKNSKMKNLLIGSIKFVFLSGVGFIIDFSVYIFLTCVCKLSVFASNSISAIPAVTFVFFTSTKTVFHQNKEGVPIWIKYIIYVVYQIVLVFMAASLGEHIYTKLATVIPSVFLTNYIKILVKIIITPITLTCNYFTMKFLTEKI